MTHHERYQAIMKEWGLEPTMNEAQVHEAWGIKSEEEEHIPLVARKSASRRNVEPTLENHGSSKGSSKTTLKINLLDTPSPSSSGLLDVLDNRINEKKKPKAETLPKVPKPRYKPPKIYTDEEVKQRRIDRVKAKRKEFQEQGLTIRGKPYVQKKPKRGVKC